MNEPYPVTAYAAANALGATTRDVVARLREGRSGVGPCPLAVPFEADRYHDTYRQALLEVIERKAKGQNVTAKPSPEPALTAPDLMSALKASLAEVRERGGNGKARSSRKRVAAAADSLPISAPKTKAGPKPKVPAKAKPTGKTKPDAKATSATASNQAAWTCRRSRRSRCSIRPWV